MTETALHDFVRQPIGDGLAFIKDRSGRRALQSRDSSQRCRFASAVRTDQSDDVALFYREANTLQGRNGSVIDDQILNFEHGQNSERQNQNRTRAQLQPVLHFEFFSFHSS